GSHSITYGQYAGYQDLYTLINAVIIDEKIDLTESENEAITDNSFISNILSHTPNYLFNLSQIGFQSYLNSPYAIDMLESLNFDCVRLGMARKNITHLEPILRDADLISIDISAVRMADAPAHAAASPNGFSGEELVQIARYAGLSDKLTSFGIYEFNPDFDVRNQTAQLIAQTIWYFIEGFYGRKGDPTQNAENSNFLKFTVKMDNFEHELVFWKSKLTERWWMEVPFGDKKKFERQQMVPCSYEDYEQACREEIPDRWMRVYTKLLDK
ncbi:MAG TPA: arginase family protein, partial [Chitinophagales bacterium]